jgi:hypothetical protein
LRLSIRDKTLLATLFAVYLAVLLRSFLVAHRS